MKRRFLLMLACLPLISGPLCSQSQDIPATGKNLMVATTAFLATLDDEQSKQARMAYETKERLGWHFIPKETRKGLQYRDMSAKQKEAARQVFRIERPQDDEQRDVQGGRLVIRFVETFEHGQQRTGQTAGLRSCETERQR